MKKLAIPDTFSEAKAASIVKAFENEEMSSNDNISERKDIIEGNQSFAGITSLNTTAHDPQLSSTEGTGSSPGYWKNLVSLVVNHGFGSFTEMAEKKLFNILKNKLAS